MKRFISILIILSVFLLAGCDAIRNLLELPDRMTSDWQTVFMQDVGSFRVPQEWYVTQTENAIYITDRPINENGYKIYLIGGIRYTREHVLRHELFENVKYIETVRAVNYGNSAGYFLARYNVNGYTIERYGLHLFSFNKSGIFVAWDDLVDEETMIQIAKTFSTMRQ